MSAGQTDPVELFNNLGWPTADIAVDLKSDAIAASILDRVLNEEGNVVPLLRTPQRRRRRLGLIAFSTVMIGTAGTVAAATLLRSSPDDNRSVSCWATAENPPSQQDVVAWDGEKEPSSLCEGSGTDLKAVCVTEAGITAVVPGPPSICAEIGLTEFRTPEPESDNARIARADELLGAELNATTCQDEDESYKVARRLLDQVGLDDWPIETIGQFSRGEPCATVALDPPNRTAYLAPVPPSP